MLTLEDAKKLLEPGIERAKKLTELSTTGPHKWIETVIPVLGKEEHTVIVYILEGVPPKGYIIVDYTLGIVKVFRKGDLRNIKTSRAYRKGETLGTDIEKSKSEYMDEKDENGV